MKSDPKSLPDLGGGMNAGAPANSISDRECANLENFIVRRSSLLRRNGLSPVFQTDGRYSGVGFTRVLTKPATGLGFFDSGQMLVAYQDGFARQDAISPWNNPIALTLDDTLAISQFPWSIVTYNGVCWCARKGTPLWRVTEFDNSSMAGIAAPVLAPGLANLGAGNVPIGSYQYFETFVSGIGDESDPSPVTAIVLAGASKVRVTVTELSGDPQVASRNIYRTLPNDTGALWLVANVPIATTIYDDDKPTAQLGAKYVPAIALPPAEAYSLCKWKERLWVHNRKQLFGSKPAMFETFAETFEDFDVSQVGREIRALHPWGNALAVGTTEKLFALTYRGVDEVGVRFGIDEISGDHGCIAHHTMKGSQGLLFFLDNDGVYATSGEAPEKVSDPFVSGLIQSYPADVLEQAVAYIDADESEYCLTLGRQSIQNGSVGYSQYPETPGEIQLVYNYRFRTWAKRKYRARTWSRAGLASPYISQLNDAAPIASASNASKKVFLSFGTYNVFEAKKGNWDCESDIPIVAKARLKSVGEPGAQSVPRKVVVDVTPVQGEMTLRIYKDARDTPAHERTSRLDTLPVRSLRRMSLGPVLAGETVLCEEFQVEFEYSSPPPIEIAGVVIDRDLYGSKMRSQ